MAQHPTNGRLAMSGNVQGFELPMGCLMTSVFILLPILAMGVGLARASSVTDVVLAVTLSVAVVAAFVLIRQLAPSGRD